MRSLHLNQVTVLTHLNMVVFHWHALSEKSSSRLFFYLHVAHHLDNNGFFKNQHDFRPGLSCKTQLFEFTTDFQYNIDSLFHTDVVYIDFSKAFDHATHQRLINKLYCLNLDPFTLSWIWCFPITSISAHSHCQSSLYCCSSQVRCRSGLSARPLMLPYICERSTLRNIIIHSIICGWLRPLRQITTPDDHEILVFNVVDAD